MSLQDPISDMLTRMRNAQARSMKNVSMPSSKQKVAVAKILQEEGFINGLDTEQNGPKTTLTIELKYYEGKPVIEMLKRISRPSIRRYSKSDEIIQVKDGLGVAIVSTSKGVMTDKSARAQGIGGEVICIVA
ncbi:MAG: 30S ribosomal protein S8 [Gammaproteobacteria bacterium]|nr:30S ribosomal protein S8 [Gammaproteobacteria bacterium]